MLLFATGCKVGPDYHVPKVEAPSQWTSHLAGGETNGPADIETWWKSFEDNDLNSLVATAVQSNLTLRVAEARVREARAQKGVTAGALWPSVGSSAGYSRNRYGQNSFPPVPGPLDFNLYNVAFDATWELDVFGGTRRAVEAANAQIGAAEYSERDVLVSLLAEVARNYIMARAYQQRLVIARENIRAQQNIVDLTSDRFRSGLGNQLDIEQAKALLTATTAQVPSLETGFVEAVHSLEVLLGQGPGTLTDQMSGTKNIPLTPPSVPLGLPSDLLQRRPDIRQAERELAAATARIGVAKADLFPKFSLTGIAGLQSVGADSFLHYASRYWSAGPSLQWQIFAAGSIVANVRVQNARQEEALNQYKQTVLVALKDVETTLIAYAKEQVRRQSLTQSVQADDRATEMATQLYKSGLVDFLRVLNSQTSLYEAQDALVQSDQTVSLNLVQLPGKASARLRQWMNMYHGWLSLIGATLNIAEGTAKIHLKRSLASSRSWIGHRLWSPPRGADSLTSTYMHRRNCWNHGVTRKSSSRFT
jgi:multidrug efflux system outer membrane protein